eukprot:gene4284-4704_t
MLIPPKLSTRLANSRLWSLSHLWPRRFAYSPTDRVKTDSLFNEQAVQPHCLTKVALSFVGTGTFPTAYRSTSCITLNLGKRDISLYQHLGLLSVNQFDDVELAYPRKEMWMFDGGDGTLRQMSLSSAKYPNLARIFISRLEPSHILGIPTVILSELGKGHPIPIHIYGPKGVARFIFNSLRAFNALHRRKIVVHELSGSYDLSNGVVDYKESYMPGDTNAQSDPAAPSEMVLDDYFSVQQLHPERNGFWRIIDNHEVTVLANTLSNGEGCGIFGFVIKEVDKQGALRIQECQRLGVPQAAYRDLKAGLNVTVEGKDRKTVVRPEDVMSPALRGRKITIISSGTHASRLLPAAQGSDVVVHNSCCLEDKTESAEKLGYSTPTIAAQFALACKAQLLVLTRFGSYLGTLAQSETQIRKELNGRYPTERLKLARDLTELSLPEGGIMEGDELPWLVSVKKYDNQRMRQVGIIEDDDEYNEDDHKRSRK